MKLLFGIDGIVLVGATRIPTARELCKIDRRLIYVGRVPGTDGRETFDDAFIHVHRPREFYVIKKAEFYDDNKKVFISTEHHYFDRDSKTLENLYRQYNKELYVGDVCDGTGETGLVWHDTYKSSLASTTLYTKNEDGTIVPVEGDTHSIPDRFGFRLVIKTPGMPDKHCAFFLGISAFCCWAYLQYHAEEGQRILHNLEPNYKRFLDHKECLNFEKTPELVRLYPECYSQEGYLNLTL